MTEVSEQPSEVAEHASRLPKLWQVVVMALIAVAFTAAFMEIYTALSSLVWANTFVLSNRWTVPVLAVVLSLCVGLTQRYLRAPTSIDGGFTESLKGEGPETDYRTFPGALLSAFCSLLSGASVGPEGPVAVLVQDIAAWMRGKIKVSPAAALGFDVAALASAFNGIIGSPLFTGVFATEYEVGMQSGLMYLVWNLLAGVIGFAFYEFLGLSAFAGLVALAPVTHLEPAYFAWALVLGVLGALLAIFAGANMQLFGRIIPRVFGERVVLRAVAAGVVIGFVGLVLPETLFSGEEQIHAIVADPARYGVGMLVLLAVLKPVLLGLSFKSGYLGGPTFPLLFACTMLGLALNLVFPTVPTSLLVTCLEGPAVAMALGAPLTAIILVSVVGTSGADALALVVLSTVVGLLTGAAARAAIARRQAQAVPAAAA
jgi:H+/Cl- antiporter ClcA